jgi:hypothetical protein
MTKALLFIVALLLCDTIFAQKALIPEFYGGVNMMRPRERRFSQGWNNDLNITGITAQLGYQYGANFRFKERCFSPIFGLFLILHLLSKSFLVAFLPPIKYIM